MEIKIIRKDVLIIGGGTAGCYAAGKIAEMSALSVLIAEKANIARSGCLAAGVNALNAYITPGHTPEDYVEYASKDANGIVRGDLLMTLSERLNEVTEDLEKMGLTILKDADGNYVSRGWRNLKINGENIKPLLAGYAGKSEKVKVLNHVNVTDFLTEKKDGKVRIRGAAGFGTDKEVFYLLYADAVLIATGGASGLYRPNNPGSAHHKMWYCPFNTGAGYAMGILAGAEMTTLEMRFIALRCKDTLAPTGTIAQGVGAVQINAKGESCEEKYGRSTAERVWGTVEEKKQGRGPCCLATKGISGEQEEDLYLAYLNMAPVQTLKWLARGKGPSLENVEIDGSEPYVVGGHAASGYWVSTDRETTISGLFAAGDVCGGAPQKYVTGALAEALIAAEAIVSRSKVGKTKNSEAFRAKAAEGEDSAGLPKKSGLSGNEEELSEKKMTSGEVPGSQTGFHNEKETVRDPSANPGVESSPTLSEISCSGDWETLKSSLDDAQAADLLEKYQKYFSASESLFSVQQVEEAMQKVMDEYAGGIRTDYSYNEAGLAIADERIRELQILQKGLCAHSMDELLQIYELRERLVVARALIAHLGARKETRWHSFQENSDHPRKKKEYELYINSRMADDGTIRIIRRPLTGRREKYEHSD